MHDSAPSTTCTCSSPIPVHRGTRKGASRTVCARCEKPLPLTFGDGPQWAA